MKHLILIAAVCVSSAVAKSQSTRVYAKHLQASEKLQLKTRSITDFSISLFSTDSSSDTKIPTAKAVADFVRARAGGGGGGAVGSVFGRTGAVVANASDYSSFYAPIVHTHPLNDLTQSGAALGQVPVWTLSGWQPGTVTGGGADSSWNSTETGIQPNQLGYIYNTTFPGTSLPAGFTDVTPAATVTVNNKLILSGGTTATTSYNSITGASTVWANRLRLTHLNYKDLSVKVTIVPQDRNSSSNGISFHFESGTDAFPSARSFMFDLSTNSDSGRIIVAESITGIISKSASLSHIATDTLEISIDREYWYILAKMTNKRTGKSVDIVYNYAAGFSTGGEMYMGVLGGTQHITKFQISSTANKGFGWTIIGDSHTAGEGASTQEKTFPSLVFRGNLSKFTTLAANGTALLDQSYTMVNNAIALGNPVLIMGGYNDRDRIVTDTTVFKVRLDSVAKPLIRAGLKVVVGTLVPKYAGTNNNFNTAILNYCAANNLQVIRIDTVLRKSSSDVNIKVNYLNWDNVHLSDSGHLVVANEIIKALGVNVSSLFSDSTSPVKFYNIPSGNEYMPVLRVNRKGELFQYPEKKFNGIENVFGASSAGGTYAQSRSAIHTSSFIRTDSVIVTQQRIHLGNSSNFAFTSARFTSGGPNDLVFPIQTGIRQVVFEPTTRSFFGNSGNYSGNDIFVAAFGNAVPSISASRIVSFSGRVGDAGTLSGSDNTFLSYESGIGITTGSNNFHAIMRNPAALSLPNSLTGSVIIGDFPQTYTPANQEVYISSGNGAFDQKFYFGAGGADNNYFRVSPTYSATNRDGSNWYFQSSSGRGTGGGGKFIFQTWAPAASGTTQQTVARTELTIERQRITLGASRFQITQGTDVASANDLTLPNDGNDFRVTGTTQINAITTINWQNGSEITLLFTGSLTVKNNTAGGAGTAVIKLEGGVDFAATADDILKLKLVSGVWYQVGKSIN
ncbi:hypothetical protein IQ13_3198 [Lacibacter cauensis]|uniref:Uncharacterized protein n=1 Tax=Lacibacter cauensis TaxID=510947 RepID=A0A562SIF3_9BACT|nr:SGNH/GDSL hydrolase family protein [Lacibacter cauensis]TWI80520.1 hypothetical protein IQ13_3198 [Lacibacter cauensis]